MSDLLDLQKKAGPNFQETLIIMLYRTLNMPKRYQ